MDAESQKRLLAKAGALLSHRAHSRGELRAKLEKIADKALVEAALDRLEQLNLLNDAEYAYNFALCRVRQDGWGPAKITDSLLRRHVAETVIESTIKRIYREVGGDFALTEYIKRHCGKKKLPADIKSVRKLILHLRQRGFNEDNIFAILTRMAPAAIMQYFESGE